MAVPRKTGWYLGATLSPEIVRSRFISDYPVYTNFTRLKWGGAAEANIAYRWKNFELGTGIHFLQVGYKLGGSYYYAPIFNNPPVYEQKIRLYRYLGIPVKVAFSAGKGKTRFTAEISASADYLVQTFRQSDITYKGGNHFIMEVKGSPEGFKNRLNVFTSVSAGIGYRFRPESELRIAPVFRYGWMDIDKNSEENDTYLWNAGISFSYYHILQFSRK